MNEFQTLMNLIKQQNELSNGLRGVVESLGKVVMNDREVLGGVLKMVERQNQVLGMLADAIGELNGENKPKIDIPQLPEGWGIINDQ